MAETGLSAVIIGASGLVGSALLTMLNQSESFSKVTAITRRSLNDCPEGVVNAVIDFERLEDYPELFKADCFFSCLGTTRKQAGSIAAQRRVDFDYQLQAAKMAKSASVEHMLLVSSSGANAASGSAYLKMKGELEIEVRQLEFNRLAILQPSLLRGTRKDKRMGESVGDVFLSALNGVGLLKHYRPIEGREVAQALIHLALNQSNPDVVYRLDELFNLQ
ncbi:NAD-dependent epimerase/dehydratase family protein [uncultured Pseudoteredinibacter sp.]|uniref:NAD-dependent epimerase/dehydratase family protein n=1 Tax=uncultured Pseudoteredinibacter sp. TaxID=1641701 RepID=UPI002638C420|nr:NAD-dependent epimerase/dehydratase family protein [uncultured Pseudoteredinibacter sp.]